jgi:hypothetical protein
VVLLVPEVNHQARLSKLTSDPGREMRSKRIGHEFLSPIGPQIAVVFAADKFPIWKGARMKLSDRRLAQRFRLNIPLYIREWKSHAPERRVEAVNVSECGAYFETEAPPREGAVVQIRLEMPNEITGHPTAEWRCTGKVTRIQPVKSSRALLGVSIRFDYYEVCRTETSRSDSASSLNL